MRLIIRASAVTKLHRTACDTFDVRLDAQVPVMLPLLVMRFGGLAVSAPVVRVPARAEPPE
jgi:hypothetical protein